MKLVPAETALAKPFELILAAAVLLELQVALFVMSCCVPVGTTYRDEASSAAEAVIFSALIWSAEALLYPKSGRSRISFNDN